MTCGPSLTCGVVFVSQLYVGVAMRVRALLIVHGLLICAMYRCCLSLTVPSQPDQRK